MIWRPCVSARNCESCREPIHPGEPVYHGEVVRLFWCAACAYKRVAKLPPADFEPVPVRAVLKPQPVKAALVKGETAKLGDIGRAVAVSRDWAKAAAGDDE